MFFGLCSLYFSVWNVSDGLSVGKNDIWGAQRFAIKTGSRFFYRLISAQLANRCSLRLEFISPRRIPPVVSIETVEFRRT